MITETCDKRQIQPVWVWLSCVFGVLCVWVKGEEGGGERGGGVVSVCVVSVCVVCVVCVVRCALFLR